MACRSPGEARMSLTSSFSSRFNAPKQQFGTVIRALIDRPQHVQPEVSAMWMGPCLCPDDSMVPVCGYLYTKNSPAPSFDPDSRLLRLVLSRVEVWNLPSKRLASHSEKGATAPSEVEGIFRQPASERPFQARLPHLEEGPRGPTHCPVAVANHRRNPSLPTSIAEV
jgi:hypothetical protein